MGFLDSLNLPTLAEVNAERRATPKGAEPSRLQAKEAKRKDESKDEARWQYINADKPVRFTRVA